MQNRHALLNTDRSGDSLKHKLILILIGKILRRKDAMVNYIMVIRNSPEVQVLLQKDYNFIDLI